ncbi:hypothetical protein [Pseudomonas sp. GR 6-02]|uniref:hypothetical protein n=1 Tax=Pseudomonas sp. GR 6-02 TaxID=1659194 RepID=UPI0007E464EB|nr:hypothetical protein [Pseudomonas sp. GR 6-02]
MFSDGYVSISNAVPFRDENRANQIQLHSRSPASLALFRTFLGGVKIDLKGGKSSLQSRNFFVLDAPHRKGFSLNADIARAFPGLGVQDRNGEALAHTIARPLDVFFRASGSHKGFFEVLLNEVSRSLVASANGNDLSAFVYIYRALEHMSYALPFFHARHATDYVKAFNDLRALISSGDGELKFCDKFIGYIFKQDPVFSAYKYTIKFDPIYAVKFEKYLNGHHSKHCTTNSGLIEVEFLKAFGFVVDVRNKFFHHLSGSNQSASSKDIIDADAFFRPINEIAWSLIALVLGKMIAAEI